MEFRSNKSYAIFHDILFDFFRTLNVDIPNNLDLKQIVRFRSNVRIQGENADIVFFSSCDNQEVDILAIVDRKWK